MITQTSKHHGAGWPAYSKVSKTHLLFFTFNLLIIPYQKRLSQRITSFASYYGVPKTKITTEAINPDRTASIGAARSWHMLFAVKATMKTIKQDLDQAAPKGTVWSWPILLVMTKKQMSIAMENGKYV